MSGAREECIAILARCEAGELSPPVALMQMLIAAEDDGLVTEVALGDTSGAAREVAVLLDRNARGCARVAAMLRSDMDRPPVNASVEEGIAFCKRLFDWSVTESEEASVALYSLGSPELLAEATREIVDVLDAWGVLGPERRVLDLGCGIGRMEEALAGKALHITGIDVSEKMIDAARRRTAHLQNVTLSTCSGKDLAAHPDHTFDLVLAVDSFPYLVQSGDALVDAHFGEARRVLAPGGDFVILNFSYRDDLARDAADVAQLAEKHGFGVVTSGTAPLRLWNAPAFRMRRRPRA